MAKLIALVGIQSPSLEPPCSCSEYLHCLTPALCRDGEVVEYLKALSTTMRLYWSDALVTAESLTIHNLLTRDSVDLSVSSRFHRIAHRSQIVQSGAIFLLWEANAMDNRGL